MSSPLWQAGALALLFTPSILWAQQPAQPLVSTTGSAQLRVIPDLADLSFEVEVRHADLALARKEEAERMVKLLAALRAAGVVEAELQSSQVRISPDYTDNRQETEKVRFYRVSQSISCTLHDVKKISDVTAGAVAAGATGVSEATLRTSQLRKYRDEARIKAIRAAKEKAGALAGELGARLGKAWSIMENPIGEYRGISSNNTYQRSSVVGDQDEAADAEFAPGTISVSAAVNVSFVLE